ncbi:MAG TPA: LysM peptidoglycan-binding domain-containing protein [Gaiellaceae bacterium]|nr:LysM peptidoglycan-binding domain-containing protein [Gaiellaceae bacterium]
MIKRDLIEALALALVSGLAAVAVVATLTGAPQPDVATSAGPSAAASATAGRATTGGGTAATSRTTAAGAAAERRTCQALADRYHVRTGDTLWGLATRHYEDASAAMARIKRRNRLRRDMLLAGEVLILPAVGRRGEGSRTDERCPTDDALPAP